MTQPTRLPPDYFQRINQELRGGWPHFMDAPATTDADDEKKTLWPCALCGASSTAERESLTRASQMRSALYVTFSIRRDFLVPSLLLLVAACIVTGLSWRILAENAGSLWLSVSSLF